MSAIILLAIVFVVTLSFISWLLSKLPPQMVSSFDSTHRHSPLDGIRGILALAVFTHHFYKNYYFQITGKWQAPAIDFFINLGSVPVSLFFLITGYLFFGKLTKSTIDWQYLYRSRVQRIVPLYLFVGVCIVLIYLTQHHPTLPRAEWQNWLVRWLTFNNQSLKGFYAWPLVAGAAWTLLYEWGFYFSLPLLFMVFHPKQIVKWQNLLILALSLPLVYFVLTHTIPRLNWLFALAFLSHWQASFFKLVLARFPIASSILLTALTAFIMLKTQTYSYLQLGLCALLFCFIANGFDYYGILAQQGLKVLGEISYSLYLTHGVVMYVCYNMLRIHDFRLPMTEYILTYPIVFLLVILFAMLSFFCIEKPLMYRPQHR